MRAALALMVLLLLPACSRDAGGPLLDSRTPPSLGARFFPPDGWGFGVLALPGAPRIRYGAVAPDDPPRADVVILPAYGESAEVYYETARDLIARGYRVWVLEAAGQGGSQRFPGAVDLGRSNGFGVDAAALEGLVLRVVRPTAGRPVIVAASGASVLTALLAAEHDRAPIDGLFLWDPALSPPGNVARAAEMTHWRLGGLRADGGSAWRRPTQDLSGRAALPAAWQLADPDLRMGGPAWEWIVADADAQEAALAGGRAKRVRAPLLIQAAQDAAVGRLCAEAPRCQLLATAPAPLPRHLAADPVRNAWLAALTGFVEARIGDGAHGA